jgi:membrane fusion protein
MPAAELGFVPPDGSREPLYRIKAALDSQTVLAYGRPQPLQAGMQVEADILLDRRRLIEWIFEPLLSLAGRA